MELSGYTVGVLSKQIQKRKLTVLEMGLCPFGEIWNLQKELVAKRQKQLIPDTLILVEHDPVYTLGKNADENHVLQTKRPEVPVYRIERGGDVTFHGPGQVVGYPILDLHDHRLSVSWYMRNLEEVIIQSLAHFGILAARRNGLTGVWVGREKISALGVRISRWVTMHGFALNVNTDLSYYDSIIPCGIFEYGVTSMEKVLSEISPKLERSRPRRPVRSGNTVGGRKKVSVKQVQDVMIDQFSKQFGYRQLEEVLSMSKEVQSE